MGLPGALKMYSSTATGEARLVFPDAVNITRTTYKKAVA
jgi:hypothetical protein